MAALNENKSGMTARSGQWLALLCAFSLAACGGGSSDGSGASQSPLAQPPGTQPPPTPPAPTVSLSAAPTAVNAGGSTQLAWSSTNASACTANGAWSGTKATSGNQTISSISVTSTYGLICTGTGGSTTRSVTVSVNAPPPPAPTVSLSAAPTTVAAGGSTLLTWSSSNASSCTASGAWSGVKVTSGNETINSISAPSTYTLTCTGNGGATARSATVNIAGTAGVSGAVDSSLLNRHQESANLVYAFAGFNSTSGTPAATVPVTQDAGACTFRYALTGLANGNYTVALTSDGGTTFKRSANVTVSSAIANQAFTPTRVVQVGPGRQFTDPSQITGLLSGDVVEIDAGTYNGPAVTWSTSNLTLRGVGGRAHPVAPATISNGKAIWVTAGTNIAVENMEFSGAAVPDKNGAGIRADGQDLAVCGSYFHDNENGVLGGGGNVLIEYSEFARNGACVTGFGCSHNMYIDAARLTLRYSYSHHANIGHLVKSRSRENYILYNRIMDEADGTSSYTIDLPNGGLSYVIGNLLQQGPNTDNPTILIYGEEGATNPSQTLYVVNNTFVNDRGSGTFVELSGGTTATLQNNLFVGGGTVVSGGAVTQTTNQTTSTPNFVNRTTFDYRPTATTPGINAGTAPGLGGTFDLTPVFQYVHPTNRQARPVNGVIDIGAYEFVP